MTKHWPTIKRGLYGCYVAAIWALLVGNAYLKNTLLVAVFAFIFLMIILESALGKIATAIRTQRNYHIIGDANEINLKGSTVYADSLSIRDRAPRVEARQ